MTHRTLGSKQCKQCGEVKPDNAFREYKKGYRRGECMACQASRQHEWYRNNPGRQDRDTHLQVVCRYGLSTEDYAAILEKQGGVCAICGRPETMKIRGATKRLAIDHCHTTGTVRGLLCHACNVGIGHFNDDTALLAKAIDYLS